MSRHLTPRKLLGYALFLLGWALLAVGAATLPGGDIYGWEWIAVYSVAVGLARTYYHRARGLRRAVLHGIGSAALSVGLLAALLYGRIAMSPFVVETALPDYRLLVFGLAVVAMVLGGVAADYDQNPQRNFVAIALTSVGFFALGILALQAGGAWAIFGTLLVPGAMVLLVAGLALRKMGKADQKPAAEA